MALINKSNRDDFDDGGESGGHAGQLGKSQSHSFLEPQSWIGDDPQQQLSHLNLLIQQEPPTDESLKMGSIVNSTMDNGRPSETKSQQ